MSINTKMRLTLLASALALAAAAPSAFADSGTWFQGIHTDPGGTPDAPAGRHTPEVMNKKVASGGTTVDMGSWYKGIHTDPGGTVDAPAGRHTPEVMQKKVAPSALDSAVMEKPWVPPY